MTQQQEYQQSLEATRKALTLALHLAPEYEQQCEIGMMRAKIDRMIKEAR